MTGHRRHAEFCRRGHDLREPGSYYERQDGGRTCKACRLASVAAWRAANPDGVAISGRHLSAETRAKIARSMSLRATAKQHENLGALIAKHEARRAAKGGTLS